MNERSKASYLFLDTIEGQTCQSQITLYCKQQKEFNYTSQVKRCVSTRVCFLNHKQEGDMWAPCVRRPSWIHTPQNTPLSKKWEKIRWEKLSAAICPGIQSLTVFCFHVCCSSCAFYWSKALLVREKINLDLVSFPTFFSYSWSRYSIWHLTLTQQTPLHANTN